MIYMLAPSSSSPSDQLALIGDRIECIQELSTPITASNGVEIHDSMRFFVVTNLHSSLKGEPR